ncbi:MAG: NAD(P)-dependent oxidoreductase [Bacteroidaceae bacterium]|nr:NAD(P)-dependent oxidoreductase [Bacteroidaceae bacterium]
MDAKRTILITGASGFIGSFLCEEALKRGFDTWAAMRRTSSKKWLQLPDLKFIELNLTNKELLKQALQNANVKFDIVVHAAGATKCLKKEDFDLHNFQCTKNLVEALAELDMMPSQLVYMSSLSAIYGSEYGNSKLKTEEWIKNFYKEKFPDKIGKKWVIMRPTGVYGPREKDYFLMAKSIKQHVDFAVGFEPQLLTFVYVRDLVDAVFAAIEKEANGQTFNVTDGEVYSSRTFSDLIQKELGVKGVVHITSPLWFLRMISTCCESFSKLTGKPSTLNRDKYKIMAQRDWTCDISPLKEILNFTPQWQLERGVKETIEWYKKENWI